MWTDLLSRIDDSLAALVGHLGDLRQQFDKPIRRLDELPRSSTCIGSAWLTIDKGFDPGRWRERIATADDFALRKLQNFRAVLAQGDPQLISVGVTTIRGLEADLRDNVEMFAGSDAEIVNCLTYRLLRETRDAAQAFIDERSRVGREQALSQLAEDLRRSNPWMRAAN